MGAAQGRQGPGQGLDALVGHSGGLDAPVKKMTRRKQKLKEHCRLKKMRAKGIPIPGAHRMTYSLGIRYQACGDALHGMKGYLLSRKRKHTETCMAYFSLSSGVVH